MALPGELPEVRAADGRRRGPTAPWCRRRRPTSRPGLDDGTAAAVLDEAEDILNAIGAQVHGRACEAETTGCRSGKRLQTPVLPASRLICIRRSSARRSRAGTTGEFLLSRRVVFPPCLRSPLTPFARPHRPISIAASPPPSAPPPPPSRPPRRRCGATAASASSTSRRSPRRRASPRSTRPRRRAGRAGRRARRPSPTTTTRSTSSHELNRAFMDAGRRSACPPAGRSPSRSSSPTISTAHGVAVFPRLVIDAGADSEVTVVERFVVAPTASDAARVVPRARGRASQAARRQVPRRQHARHRRRGSSAISRRSATATRTTLLATVALGGDYARVRTEARVVGPGRQHPAGRAVLRRRQPDARLPHPAGPRRAEDAQRPAVQGCGAGPREERLHRADQDPARRQGLAGVPDQPQPHAQRGRVGRERAQPRHRDQRREVQPRQHRRPDRRGAALLPREPRHPARGRRAPRGARLLRRGARAAARRPARRRAARAACGDQARHGAAS